MAISLDDVDPDLRDAAERIDGAPDLPLWALRLATRLLRAPATPGVTVTAERHDGIRMRIYRPQAVDGGGASAVLLWLHGGGLLFGDAKQDEALCASTSVRLGIPVVSVNYRFAPGHPFPVPLDEVHAGWRWLVDNARRLGADPARIVVAGESAGGGLAASLVQRVIDEGGPAPIAQWLFAPMIDDRTAARTISMPRNTSCRTTSRTVAAGRATSASSPAPETPRSTPPPRAAPTCPASHPRSSRSATSSSSTTRTWRTHVR